MIVDFKIKSVKELFKVVLLLTQPNITEKNYENINFREWFERQNKKWPLISALLILICYSKLVNGVYF